MGHNGKQVMQIYLKNVPLNEFYTKKNRFGYITLYAQIWRETCPLKLLHNTHTVTMICDSRLVKSDL